MMLFLCGEDISRLSLGLMKDESGIFLKEPEVIPASPEEYLGMIDAYLKKHVPVMQDLSGIIVAGSLGSATALRSAYSIANAFVFARALPLFQLDKGGVLKRMHIALPEYGNAVHITASVKDALKRRA